MLNKLPELLRRYDMAQPGDSITCAVSGGADSMALLWAMYLLKEELHISLAAAHFNHGLRGEESDRDEGFVRQFCQDYHIPFFCGRAAVKAGKKGLEAAARDARYGYFDTLPGKIATAHTADDNAETVLLHLVRGTGLKGLGGIAPVNGKYIRPMLTVTREEVLAFLAEYSIPHITDSSNETDDFLRNRLRHHVMPLLKQENPRLAENLSATAFSLRQDEEALTQKPETDVLRLRRMAPAHRSRAIGALLESFGVREPEREHILLTEKLVFSPKASGRVNLPGGVTVRRRYDTLEKEVPVEGISPAALTCPGEVTVPQLGLRVICRAATEQKNTPDCFTVRARGKIVVRSRQAGDTMKAYGGTKAVKKLFIDKKIPAAVRPLIPVVADEEGILGVYTIGPDQDRLGTLIEIKFERENQGGLTHEK